MNGSDYPDVVFAIGNDRSMRRAAKDWARLHQREVWLGRTGRAALRQLALRPSVDALVMVGHHLPDMPPATVVCTARNLLGPGASVVGVVDDTNSAGTHALYRAGARWCVTDPRQILHPSSPLFSGANAIPAA